MPNPIPLRCGDNAGTGFLVADADAVWLTTCVHVVSGLLETPPLESMFRMARIQVAGTSTILPLFVDGQQRISMVTHAASGYLVDAIALRLRTREIESLGSYGMFEAASIVKVEVGETVTVSGFPGLGSSIAAGATTFEPGQVPYGIDMIAGLSIRLSAPGIVGLSGGPVSNELGLVGIMHGDVGAGASMTNGLAISLAVLGEHLFV